MRIKLFGINVYISYIFVCVITVFIATDKSGLFCPLLCSIILHETAHVIALFSFGCRIKKITLNVGTIGVDYSRDLSKTESIISLLAGPLVNMITAYVLYVADYMELFGVNFIVGFVNLLPVVGLDGGSVIETLFSGIISGRILTFLMFVISSISVLSLVVLNLIFLGSNISVIIFCIYLILPIILKILLKER